MKVSLCIICNYVLAIAVFIELHGIMANTEWAICKPLARYETQKLSFLVGIVAPFAFRIPSSRETCHAVNGNLDGTHIYCGVVFI